MGVVEITKENFETEVLGPKVPVVIDFWADGCSPCQMQAPVLDALAEKLNGKVKFCKVNVDEQPGIAMNYQIASIPTLVFMKYGLFQKRLIGLSDEKDIMEGLEPLLDEE